MTTATICIPTTRTSDSLALCLASLERQSRQDFEVLLIMKDTDTSPIKSTVPLRIISQKRAGLVGAMNDALEHVKTPLTIRIDDDVVVAPSWFEAIVQSFSQKDVGGVTGPTLISADELSSRDLMKWITRLEKSDNILLKPLKWLYFDFIYQGQIKEIGRFLPSGVFSLGSNFEASLRLKNPIEVDHVEACNFAFRTELLQRFGGFDPRFTKGLGDYHEADISFKVTKAGYRILFDPKAIAHHHIGTGVAEDRGEAYDRMRNFVRFYKRHLSTQSPDGWIRFAANISIQHVYFFYKWLKTGHVDNLGGPIGTVVELCTHE